MTNSPLRTLALALVVATGLGLFAAPTVYAADTARFDRQVGDLRLGGVFLEAAGLLARFTGIDLGVGVLDSVVAGDMMSSDPTGAEDMMSSDPTGAEDMMSSDPTGAEDMMSSDPTGAEDMMSSDPTGAEDMMSSDPTGRT